MRSAVVYQHLRTSAVKQSEEIVQSG